MEVEQAKWELYNQCSVALQFTRRLLPCCEDLLTQEARRRCIGYVLRKLYPRMYARCIVACILTVSSEYTLNTFEYVG